MPHVVLLGDSILDNARYVPGCPAVVEQLRTWLSRDWRVTLLARDGVVTSQVEQQLSQLPEEATHLVVSVGGNDVLENSYLVREPIGTATELLKEVSDTRTRFRKDYEAMLRTVLAHQRPTIVCTVYDAISEMTFQESLLLSLFNDVMLRESIRFGLPVLDLRWICTDARDYSALSPIEPSEVGGAKIVRGLRRILQSHDFSRGESVVYSS